MQPARGTRLWSRPDAVRGHHGPPPAYVSPRTGRAVSREAGRAYQHKLLALPEFLWSPAPADTAQIAAGLRLTEHFLLHHVLLPQDRALPPARARLAARLRPDLTVTT